MTHPLSSRQFRSVYRKSWSRENDQEGWTVQVVWSGCTRQTRQPQRQLHVTCGWPLSTRQEPLTDHGSDGEVLPSVVPASPVDLCICTPPYTINMLTSNFLLLVMVNLANSYSTIMHLQLQQITDSRF